MKNLNCKNNCGRITYSKGRMCQYCKYMSQTRTHGFREHLSTKEPEKRRRRRKKLTKVL